MIRFSYAEEIHSKELRKQFVAAGARPSMYSYYPKRECWSLTMPSDREGVIVREVLDRLGVEYCKVVVATRFDPVDAG